MSLDGLRAWIGVVERKLTMRTRVFLVLVAIAIGGAAVGIVLAVDAQDNAVSKGDLQAVRDELTGASAPAEAPDVTALEAEIETLRSEVTALRGESEGSKGTGGAAAPQGHQQLEEATEEPKEGPEGKNPK